MFLQKPEMETKFQVKSEVDRFPALKSWLIHHGIPSTVLRTQEMLNKALLTGRQDTERSNECNGQDQSSEFQVTL